MVREAGDNKFYSYEYDVGVERKKTCRHVRGKKIAPFRIIPNEIVFISSLLWQLGIYVFSSKCCPISLFLSIRFHSSKIVFSLLYLLLCLLCLLSLLALAVSLGHGPRLTLKNENMSVNIWVVDSKRTKTKIITSTITKSYETLHHLICMYVMNL